MTIQEYLHKINDRYKLGIATEHTYRGDLQSLLETLAPGINVTNEPSRIECGAPDYILSKGKEIFWHLVKLGGELRQLHLLESPATVV